MKSKRIDSICGCWVRIWKIKMKITLCPEHVVEVMVKAGKRRRA